ncbi:hypothetical protein [Pseudomonas sp. 58(2021)]|uniref:hypothetical protein n=1 Tax=Pseudomonas sp. 58(2021) TaxID=2813330 RepID=UPI001A9EB45E|nr:hypothetical protein [Pseudomonas sp. 58(2021)]
MTGCDRSWAAAIGRPLMIFVMFMAHFLARVSGGLHSQQPFRLGFIPTLLPELTGRLDGFLLGNSLPIGTGFNELAAQLPASVGGDFSVLDLRNRTGHGLPLQFRWPAIAARSVGDLQSGAVLRYRMRRIGLWQNDVGSVNFCGSA